MRSKNFNKIPVGMRRGWLGACLSLMLMPVLPAQESATNNNAPIPGNATVAAGTETAAQLLIDSYHSYQKGELDASLQSANDILKLDAQNKGAHLLRAAIFCQKKLWDQSDAEYQIVLAMQPDNVVVKFDRADLKFMQKKYDDAKPGFIELENDQDVGDFSKYKAFLCDLFGSHEDIAAQELQAFDQAAENPSYFFANVAWSAVHSKPEDAASWLKSAQYIYANTPQKITSYSSSLTDLGYLPLHLATSSPGL